MKILIVDDSILIRGMLKSLIESFDDFTVAGEAPNGKKAIEMVLSVKPDLVLMDINMPEMDGITATEIIMKTSPLPVVIFTSEDVAEVGFRALNKGALEVIPKPDINQMNNPEFRRGFETILKHVVRYAGLKLSRSPIPRPSEDFDRATFSREGLAPAISPRPAGTPYRLVVMGASTGGPTAVRTVLSGLPADFPLPLILSQHIEVGFDTGYAEWLNDATPLHVRIARKHDQTVPGEVLVAPATHHLITRNGEVLWDDGPRVGNQKPSIDKMFTSAAETYGAGVVGILLTGMGRDGALGCERIVKSGGKTLVQDEESSMIFGMPRAAIELNAASEVVALKDMAEALIHRIRR